MAYSLNRYEQEVVINFNAEEDTATLYTANPVWIRKMDKITENNPEQFKMYRQEKIDGKVISKSYKFPKKFVSIRTKDRVPVYTEEQRAASAQRIKAANRK